MSSFKNKFFNLLNNLSSSSVVKDFFDQDKQEFLQKKHDKKKRL